MEPDQMRRLGEGWASAADGIYRTDDVPKDNLAALSGMINHRHWRPYSVAED